MNTPVLHASIDPYHHSQSVSINFASVYKIFNVVGDIFFTFVLFFKESDQTQAIFIILFASVLCLLLRIIAVVHYTPKVKNSYLVFFLNLFFGSTFYINRQSSVPRDKLQHFPLGTQILDQLNLHKISCRMYLFCSVYSIFIITFKENARLEEYFQFYLVKFVMTLIAFIVEILAEDRRFNNFLLLSPILFSSAFVPLLASYSSLSLDKDGDEGYNFVWTLLRFYFMTTMIILRLVRTERVTMVLRRSKTHVNFGIVLFLVFFLFFFWDIANIVVSCFESKKLNEDIIDLANCLHSLLVLFFMNFVYRFEVFKDIWFEPETVIVDADVALINQDIEAEGIHHASL